MTRSHRIDAVKKLQKAMADSLSEARANGEGYAIHCVINAIESLDDCVSTLAYEIYGTDYVSEDLEDEQS